MPQRVEDLGGVIGDWWVGLELLVAEPDRDVSQWAERADDLPDGPTGAGLEVAGDRQGGEHDGQTRVRSNGLVPLASRRDLRPEVTNAV